MTIPEMESSIKNAGGIAKENAPKFVEEDKGT